MKAVSNKINTIYDVAKKAGVSPATVSRVLNAPDTVAADKRMRVQNAIHELNFVPKAEAFVFVFNADNVSGNFQCGPEFAASLSFDLSKLANHLIQNNKNNKSNESQSFNQEELNENED